ncbi:hypothetical protein Vadar_013252 [Vaccinium darrowii]|uniref:Uncharacterized protein n=1 Tax=Vaccinium darrowii TaxID=229202 RepID=A0ACB7ZDK0_9ERIC|nr:hypothetical protein Vadar_013252 [Vaccinium darrowii]
MPTTGILHDQNLEKHIEKQMGCMAGFFQLFDRYHFLTGKRIHSNKRLPPPPPPPPPVIDSPPSSESLKASQPEIVTPVEKQSKPPLPVPVFQPREGARSTSKLCKEAPRFSLDSRANFTATGSPSVVARLMGLEQLPQSSPEPIVNAELRRSASESRLPREPFQYQFIDNVNFQIKQQPNQSHSTNISRNNAVAEKNSKFEPPNPRGVVGGSTGARNRESAFRGIPLRPYSTGSPRKPSQQRKSYFAPEDFFPDPKQMASSIYGEIEKRLKTRGIDEQANDLEALKHILEALQLKGLLHSQITNHRNERSFSSHQSPIVVMKPSGSPIPPRKRTIATDSPPTGHRTGTGTGARRSLTYGCECSPGASPRRERPENNRNVRDQARARNSSSPTRREINSRTSNSPTRGRALDAETQRRASPVNSPKLCPKRIGSDQTIANRSPRNRKTTAKIDPKEKIGGVNAEDESSSVSESSVGTPSITDTERSKMEDCKGGSSLLERCDKLLHSIGEVAATELQPSPVSVLDSSFYKDESFSPSPVMKRSINFKEQLGEFEEEIWSTAVSPIQSKREDKSDNCDFIYISEILRASNYLPDDTDLFALLEKQQYLIGNDTSKHSTLQRKLIFDTVAEILDAKKQLPPWKVISSSHSASEKPSLHQIWIEYQRIRQRDATAEDLFDVICAVLRKDLAGEVISGWEDSPVEMSEAALDIERLIFKDLVGETIRDLGVFYSNNVVSGASRKLVF